METARSKRKNNFNQTHMSNVLEEQLTLLKEKKYNFQNIPAIVAKIYAVDDSSVTDEFGFKWEINYYNKLVNEGIYQPGAGATYGRTLAETEKRLEDYVKRFTDAVGWEKNNQF